MVKDVFGIVGTSLSGTFQVESVVAEGGFGVVYRAEHIAFRAQVALKCLKIPQTMSPEQRDAFIEGFREEAEMLFHLSSQIPEVVRPLHADAIALPDGNFMPYIAMEWIEGKPLDSIIILREDRGEPPLGLRQVIKMLTPIAHALHRAHFFEVPGGGVVSVNHCDLKPENILIVEQGPVPAKILDFGIAKARELVATNVGHVTDSEGSRPFTPSYGAPEQWVPKKFGTTGPWTDVWGMALTMVECLTGKPPIDGDLHSMMGTALDEHRRPTPRNEGAAIPEAVDAVFRRALAVDPRQRYQDMEAFWTDLERAFGVPSSFARARRGFHEEETPAPEPEAAWNPRELGADFDAAVDPEAVPIGGELELEMEAGPPSQTDVQTRTSESSGRYDLGERASAVPNSGGRVSPPAGATGPQKPIVAPTTGVAARPGFRVEVDEPRRSTVSIPIAMIVLGAAMTAADVLLQQASGPIALGPLKLRWIGALLAVLGMVLTMAALVGKDEDG